MRLFHSPGAPSHLPCSHLCARVMDLLLPGENVLQALRRLSAVRQPLGPGGAGAGSEAGAGRISPTGDDPMSHHPRAPRTQVLSLFW